MAGARRLRHGRSCRRGSSSSSSNITIAFEITIWAPQVLHILHIRLAIERPEVGCISTNDALCAFIWRHITRAHTHVASTLQPTSPSSQGPLNFALVVEARRRMLHALPTEYLGNAVFYCPVTSDLTTVASPNEVVGTLISLIVPGGRAPWI